MEGRQPQTGRTARAVLGALALLITGLAHPASLESLVMPGPVTAAHSDIEDECSNCHAPFSRNTQSGLCLDCHEDIAADLSARRGFHGGNGRLADQECRACHTEHAGRDADITGLVPEAFDHALTGFELTGRHAAAGCRDCHDAGDAFRDVADTCAGCHAGDDPHQGNLGDDCASCHTTERWTEPHFDHQDATDFALVGGHRGLACESCHAGQTYQETPTQCAACHALDDVHQGRRGDDCAACHTEQAWSDARFDHAAETGFVLEGHHAGLACSACHLDDMALAEPPTTCAGCHSADDVHGGRRGDDCAACHGQETWKTRFDHAQTGFELVGAHADAACDACHRGDLEQDLPTDCEGCHQADDPHGGRLSACTDCHDPSGWTRSLRFDHEFTGFPLLGLHRLAACEQCHASLDFHEAGSACLDCHAGDDVHDGSLGDDCADCHTPSGWSRWLFDHDTRTDFPLAGAHRDLACAGCHPPGRPNALTVSTTCASCHQRDDVHNGQFGDRCERCHTTESFADRSRMP